MTDLADSTYRKRKKNCKQQLFEVYLKKGSSFEITKKSLLLLSDQDLQEDHSIPFRI